MPWSSNLPERSLAADIGFGLPLETGLQVCALGSRSASGRVSTTLSCSRLPMRCMR
jgi:hypothetical protein